VGFGPRTDGRDEASKTSTLADVGFGPRTDGRDEASKTSTASTVVIGYGIDTDVTDLK
jgi:hypothetical protein